VSVSRGDRGRWWRRPLLAALLLVAVALLLRAGDRLLPHHTPARRYTVEIRELAFHPAVLEVARGDTVVWINRDIFPHTASSTGEAGSEWDTGTLSQGQEGHYVATRAGDWAYICKLHPVMRGRVVVR